MNAQQYGTLCIMQAICTHVCKVELRIFQWYYLFMQCHTILHLLASQPGARTALCTINACAVLPRFLQQHQYQHIYTCTFSCTTYSCADLKIFQWSGAGNMFVCIMIPLPAAQHFISIAGVSYLVQRVHVHHGLRYHVQHSTSSKYMQRHDLTAHVAPRSGITGSM
jgi:hypothetical protein